MASIIKFPPLLLSERQKKVKRYLEFRDPQLAPIYIGACRVLADTHNPDRLCIAGNSLREVNNILFRTPNQSTVTDIKETLPDEENNKIKIALRLSAEGLSHNDALQKADIWNKINRFFVKCTHHGKIDESKFFSNTALLEDNILSYIGPFYVSIDQIDLLINRENPTKDDLKQLKSLIGKAPHKEYFLSRVLNWHWIKLLSGDEMFNFKSPPEIIIGDDGQQLQPVWLELKCIIKLIPTHPNEVADVISKMAFNTIKDNQFSWFFLLDALILLPTELSSTLITKLKIHQWPIDRANMIFSDKIRTIIQHFITQKEYDSAFILTEKLLQWELISDTSETSKELVSSKIDFSVYEELLENEIPQLATYAPLQVIELLIFHLKSIVKKAASSESYFLMRRHSIKSTGININHDIRNILVTALRNILENLDEDLLHDSIALLEDSDNQYPLLSRMRVYLCNKKFAMLKDEADTLVTDRSIFNNQYLEIEVNCLLSEHYREFLPKVQKKILNLIQLGPNNTLKKTSQKDWRNRKLWLIKDYLPSRLKVKASKLPYTHASIMLDAEPTVIWSGSISPVSEDELRNKTPAQVVHYLKTWTPERGDRNPTAEGLAHTFRNLVSKEASIYSKSSSLIDATLAPIYINSFLEGLAIGCKTEPITHWQEIIALCKKLIKTIEIRRKNSMNGYQYIFGNIAQLLQQGLEKDHNKIPYAQANNVFNIISTIINLNLFSEDENNNTDNEETALSNSLNTTKGASIHALIRYALWYAGYRSSRKDKKTILIPKVVKLLNILLTDTETNIVRSVLGLYFTNLYIIDKNWATKNLSIIFSCSRNHLFNPALYSYLISGNYHQPCVKAMKDVYLNAVKQLEKNEVSYSEYLARHIAIMYVDKTIELSDEVMHDFFGLASDKVHSYTVEHLSRWLENYKPQKVSQGWKRLKDFWNARIKSVSTNKSLELSKFVSWLEYSPDNSIELDSLISSTIPHLSSYYEMKDLVAFLERHISTMCLPTTLKLLKSALCSAPHLFSSKYPEIEPILLAGSKVKKLKDITDEIISKFGELGNHSYKHLISN